MDGVTLRDARKSKGIKLLDIADRLKRDPSYLSHIERGRKPVTAQVLAAYREALGGLDAVTESEPLAASLISIMRNTRPYNKGRWSQLFARAGPRFRDEAVAAKALNPAAGDELGEFFSEVARSMGSTSGRTVFFWNHLAAYRGTPIGRHYHSIVANCIDSGLPFAHFVVQDKGDGAAQTAKWLVKNTLKYILYKDSVAFDAVNDLDFGLFEIDFLVVADRAANIRLADGEFGHKKNNVVIRDPSQIQSTLSYLRRIENHRDNKVMMYLGDGELARFLDAYAAVDFEAGDRALCQQFFGGYSVSPDNYRPGTAWWRRYQAIDFDVGRLAESRKRSASALKTRLDKFRFRQICSPEVIREWAKNGVRPDLKSRHVVETPAERRSRIDYVIHLLRTQDRFSLGLHKDTDGGKLGWTAPFAGDGGRFSEERTLAWLVQGNRILLESTLARVEPGWIAAAETGPPATAFQCYLNDEDGASSFRDLFDQTWKQLPNARKDKREVIGFLESLKGGLSVRS